MELVKDRETKEHFPAESGLGPRLTQGFADQGLFLRGGDIMNIMPPLCVTPGEIEQIVSTMDSVIGRHRTWAPRKGVYATATTLLCRRGSQTRSVIVQGLSKVTLKPAHGEPVEP